jgi:hypothetical protein
MKEIQIRGHKNSKNSFLNLFVNLFDDFLIEISFAV